MTLTEQTAWVNALMMQYPDIAKTAWRVTVVAGLASIEVTGGYTEAHAWHEAVGGRIFPSVVNADGVRRQMIHGRNITVDVVQLNVSRTGLPLVGGH